MLAHFEHRFHSMTTPPIYNANIMYRRCGLAANPCVQNELKLAVLYMYRTLCCKYCNQIN